MLERYEEVLTKKQKADVVKRSGCGKTPPPRRPSPLPPPSLRPELARAVGRGTRELGGSSLDAWWLRWWLLASKEYPSTHARLIALSP